MQSLANGAPLSENKDPDTNLDALEADVSELEELLRAFAHAFFFEPTYVNEVARYMVEKYCNPSVPAIEVFDSLISGILHAPLSMKLFGFRGLADQRHTEASYILVLEPFLGVPIGIPTEFLFRSGLKGVAQALGRIVARAPLVYTNIRRGCIEADYVLEGFTTDAARLIAKYAWPCLLVTLCYFHFVGALDKRVKNNEVALIFAMDVMRASRKTLTTVITGGSAAADELRRGRKLSVISRANMELQLSRLNDILSGPSLGQVRSALERFAGELAASCTASVQ